MIVAGRFKFEIKQLEVLVFDVIVKTINIKENKNEK